MNRELKMSYETMGASTYVTVTCPPSVQLVNYELEMMMGNEIKNFMKASRQMMDGEIVLYYNITSKISLSQVLEKRKLNRKELFCLINGTIEAVRDAAAYRLHEAGIVLDPDYIYVNPATCAPVFMYLPLAQSEETGIKGLLSYLILHDKIEMSNDNFIQVLLTALNFQPFSLEHLEQSLKSYQSQNTNQPYGGQNGYSQSHNMMQNVQPQSVPVPTPMKQPVNPQPVNIQPVRQETVQETQQPIERPTPKKNEFGKPAKKRADKKKASEEPIENARDSEIFDMEKAKKKFLLPQALVMVVVAAGISFGLFTNKDGGIEITNILALLIVIGLGEVILYREIFVNSKKAKTTKKSKTTKASAPQKKGRPEMPKAPNMSAKPEISRQTESRQSVPVEVPAPVAMPVMPQTPPVQPVPEPVYRPVAPVQYPMNSGMDDTDIGGETELLDGGAGNAMAAYLEYYEDGTLNRIPLDSPTGVTVGRLKQQVDFAVKSPKVGKVHARFFGQNGQYYVTDINSKNGTYINGNGSRIESNMPYPLHDKDRIMLADSEFTIRCS